MLFVISTREIFLVVKSIILVLEGLIVFFFFFFFPPYGRCEKNQESPRIFIILSCSDPTVKTNVREKIQILVTSGADGTGRMAEGRSEAQRGNMLSALREIQML